MTTADTTVPDAIANLAEAAIRLGDVLPANVAIPGYPHYLPSFNEFVADLQRWHEVFALAPPIGTRYRLTVDVDRLPDFYVPAGATGTLVAYHDAQVRLKLDETVPGADEWDNEIIWDSSMADGYDGDVFRWFSAETERVKEDAGR